MLLFLYELLDGGEFDVLLFGLLVESFCLIKGLLQFLLLFQLLQIRYLNLLEFSLILFEAVFHLVNLFGFFPVHRVLLVDFLLQPHRILFNLSQPLLHLHNLLLVPLNLELLVSVSFQLPHQLLDLLLFLLDHKLLGLELRGE